MSEQEKDVVILAYPGENRATIGAETADGMLFMKQNFQDINAATEKATVTGEQVSEILSKIREKRLRFSFRKGPKDESDS